MMTVIKREATPNDVQGNPLAIMSGVREYCNMDFFQDLHTSWMRSSHKTLASYSLLQGQKATAQ